MIKLNRRNTEYTSSVSEDNIPRDLEILIGKIKAIHWNVRVAKESAGWVIYLPDPVLLSTDGRKELISKHTALLFCKVDPNNKRIGKYSYDPKYAATCMKTGKTYPLDYLLKMAPMNQRGYPWLRGKQDMNVSYSDTSKCLIKDSTGKEIPDHPGDVVSVMDLPPDHPCIEFIRDRGFEPEDLWKQFRASYCIKEAPEDEDKGRFYRKLPFGFKDTPQGRLILYADMNGSQMGWQARVLERKDEDGDVAFWHPYNNRWEFVKGSDGNWVGTPEDLVQWKGLAKYKSAFGQKRTKLLLGFDAAVEYVKNLDIKDCILVEGPLDAGVIGPPAISMMGKHLSDGQSRAISRAFDRVTFIPDNDEAGNQTANKVMQNLNAYNRKCKMLRIDKKYKDVGEMPVDVAREEINLGMRLLWE